MAWLREQLAASEDGQRKWEALVAQLNTPPTTLRELHPGEGVQGASVEAWDAYAAAAAHRPVRRVAAP